MSLLRRLTLCASYVTCLPIHVFQLDISDEALAGLTKYLPAVGIIIGVCLNLSTQVSLFMHAPYLVQAAMVTLLWFVFTSGLHLDGLMDTADGIFSHQSKSRMLDIMQDPRVGNFGVIVGVMLILTKFAAIASIGHYKLVVAVLLIPAWARVSEVYAIGNFPYLREFGKGKIWHDTTQYPRDLWLSMALPVLVTAGASISIHSPYPVAISAATFIAGILCTRWLNTKLDGQTGDTYGATVEFSEAAGLTVAAILQNFIPT